MQQLIDDIIHPTWLPFSVIAARLGLAVVLGAAIGFEREWRQHAAGLRTHILVSLAAATVAILTIEMAHLSYFDGENIRLDPVRVIEAVTSGVAFLAAGLIVFARGEVRGLTTGAGMWLAGAIGLCCGLGFWGIAVYAAILALVVLSLLRTVERKLSPRSAKEPETDVTASSPARTGTDG